MGGHVHRFRTKRYDSLLMDFQKTKQAIEKFAKLVISLSRRNLTRKDINTSKELYKSLDYVVNVYDKEFSVQFKMLDYGAYLDQGVHGSKSSYIKTQKSPFKYSGRFKSIPPSSLDKWMIKKGIAPRNVQGQFMDRKSLKFLIARSIYQKGIEATHFFTRPFESRLEKLEPEVIEAFGLDIDEFFELTT